MEALREVWVTGLGLVSSLGEGHQAHWDALTRTPSSPVRIDATRFAPYSVHPLADVDIDRLISSKTERKQMGIWQRLGVHAAGLALQDAGVAGDEQVLDRMDLVVAAGNGERDLAFDAKVLAQLTSGDCQSDPDVAARVLNGALTTGLRPTLYLGELSNLLAGNIQIVHKVTGSSRTLKGEEISGLSAIEDAVRRVASGQADIVLVGGALNSERNDLLLNYELAGGLWSHPFVPVWQRDAQGGGFVLGTAAAFIVIEARDHAEQRGAKGYARIAQVVTDRCARRVPGEISASLAKLATRLADDLADGALAVLSWASGAAPATAEELSFLRDHIGAGRAPVAVRAYGSCLGHSVEAHAPMGLALAALALSHDGFYPPFKEPPDAVSAGNTSRDTRPVRILLTSVGHWRGEGLALVEKIGGGVRTA